MLVTNPAKPLVVMQRESCAGTPPGCSSILKGTTALMLLLIAWIIKDRRVARRTGAKAIAKYLHCVMLWNMPWYSGGIGPVGLGPFTGGSPVGGGVTKYSVKVAVGLPSGPVRVTTVADRESRPIDPSVVIGPRGIGSRVVVVMGTPSEPKMVMYGFPGSVQ